MPKWEYKLVTEQNNRPDIEYDFNQLGREGWMLVCAPTMRTNFDVQYVTVFVFKRPIKRTLEPPVNIPQERLDKLMSHGTEEALERKQ